MVDLVLVWYAMDDEDVRATRVQVRTWAQDLRLPAGTLSQTSTEGAFRKTLAETVVEFTDAGRTYTLRSRPAGGSKDVVKYELMSVCADSVEKVAEVKLFQQRRTSAGVVAGSQRWKSVIKPALAGAQRDAAKTWLEQFRAHYNERAVDAPALSIRRIARLALLEAGIPVLNRLGVYLFYADQLAVVDRVEEFLSRAVLAVDVARIPILPGREQSARFAESADDWVGTQIRELHEAITSWGARASTAASPVPERFAGFAAGFSEAITEHERRLDWPLVYARSVLTDTVTTLTELTTERDTLLLRNK